MTPDQLAEHVRRIVDDAPPLTEDQRIRIATVLRPSTEDTPAMRHAA